MHRKTDLLTLLEATERLSLDDRLFFRFQNSNEVEVCLSFRRDAAPSSWCLWYALNEAASRRTVSYHHLPAALQSFSIPEAQVYREIANTILTQAAFADEFIHEVERVLGTEAVAGAIRQTQDFMESLRDMVNGVLSSQPSHERKPPEAPPVRLQIVKADR